MSFPDEVSSCSTMYIQEINFIQVKAFLKNHSAVHKCTSVHIIPYDLMSDLFSRGPVEDIQKEIFDHFDICMEGTRIYDFQ